MSSYRPSYSRDTSSRDHDRDAYRRRDQETRRRPHSGDRRERSPRRGHDDYARHRDDYAGRRDDSTGRRDDYAGRRDDSYRQDMPRSIAREKRANSREYRRREDSRDRSRGHRHREDSRDHLRHRSRRDNRSRSPRRQTDSAPKVKPLNRQERKDLARVARGEQPTFEVQYILPGAPPALAPRYPGGKPEKQLSRPSQPRQEGSMVKKVPSSTTMLRPESVNKGPGGSDAMNWEPPVGDIDESQFEPAVPEERPSGGYDVDMLVQENRELRSHISQMEELIRKQASTLAATESELHKLRAALQAN